MEPLSIFLLVVAVIVLVIAIIYTYQNGGCCRTYEISYTSV